MTPAVEAAKSAASVMAMNNVYYRFVHLASNPKYKTMPARLRMNWLGNPRVDRTDFELWALAVSAINGCGACMDAHEKAAIRRQLGPNSNGRALCRHRAVSCGCDRGGRAWHATSGEVIRLSRTLRRAPPGPARGGRPYSRAEFAECALASEYVSLGRFSASGAHPRYGEMTPP